MTDVRAIPTIYNGVEFRSRLEARWAVFFDAMRVRWEYEIEGFELAAGRDRICRHDDKDKPSTSNHPRILAAYSKALSFKFDAKGIDQ